MKQFLVTCFGGADLDEEQFKMLLIKSNKAQWFNVVEVKQTGRVRK